MLKKILFSVFFAASLIGVGIPTTKVNAQVEVTPYVVVLDVDAIRRDAASVKSIREQIVSYRNQLQSEIQQENEELRTAQQELAQKQALLAPEAFAEERRKFEERVAAVQRNVAESRRALEQSQAQAMIEVETVLNDIVATIAQQNGYGVVIRRSQIVVVDRALDITDTVLAELNARLTTVNVDLPAQ